MSVLKSVEDNMEGVWEYIDTPIEGIDELLTSGEYEIEVDSPDGYVPVTHFINKGKQRIYDICVGDATPLRCSGKHVVFTNTGWVLVKDLNTHTHTILTDDGYKPFLLSITNIYEDVVDIRVDHPNHRYYTNNIVSHNTNMGKSLIMGALATNNMFAGKKVLYISCEMSEFKIGERVLANSFDVSTKDIPKLSRNKFGQAFAKARSALEGRFVVKEYPTGSLSVAHIRTLVKELELKRDFVPDIIYIDYIGIMTSTFKSKSDNTYTIQKRITEEVRGLAVELAIPFVSAIQTNRMGMGKEELDMTNTSDSIGTAFTADIMIGVTQPDELRLAGKYRWSIIKNRYGINKVGVTIKVNYDKMRLTDDVVVSDEYEKPNSSEEPVKAKPSIKKRKPISPKTKEVPKRTKKDVQEIEY